MTLVVDYCPENYDFFDKRKCDTVDGNERLPYNVPVLTSVLV